MSKENTIIHIENKMSCLPGFENLDTESISKRMPRRNIKTIKELQYDKERKDAKQNRIKY
tara:strand:- start:935 stop:1114 length:180 start_codon:yes stop_codon:yes gene_type:complete